MHSESSALLSIGFILPRPTHQLASHLYTLATRQVQREAERRQQQGRRLLTMASGRTLDRCFVLGMLLLCTAEKVFSQEVQAENVTVVEGGMAEISCRLHQYDGSIVVIQNPSRQTLFFNGTRALRDERFQMVEFTQKLVKIHLTNAKLDDEGGYFCQLYTEDTHHQIATLTVLVPPENPLVEVNEQAVEGGEIELTCISPRTKPAASLRWYRDRKELKGIASKQENIKTFSITNSIRFTVDRKDNGEIVTCEASHPALKGQKKQTQYVLDVQFSPIARIQSSQSVVREGELLTLKCEVTGNPRPTEIIWSRLNDSLPERAQIQGDLLTFPALSMQDNGTYSCQVSNKRGRSSDQYVLVVYDPGAIIAAQTQVPYAVIGGILALLVFLVICVLIVMVWCSVRQKGSYLTHEASGLDEHGEAREAFLNGGENHKRKEEFFI
ncbi:cell adhesion molecule 4 [Bombina bombina]|uniref:cell adhesion molecule 4 n=1 Tax=Bombina bombina TaxID=8345 RepID=UPI00235A9F3B|nr:cell adhesion molecule 4 [Bombina bombina]